MIMTAEISQLKAPFPWFGGKRRVAHIVWPRFGNVPNYVEPFAGSLAVMLARPEEWEPRNETINDLDCYVANFWRALREDPEGVAAYADWPVNEADLHARHEWLHAQAEFRERMHTDPDHYDSKLAGWWVWGLSAWIGDNWCAPDRNASYPDLRCNRGINRNLKNGKWNARPQLMRGLKRGGAGIHAGRSSQERTTHMKRPDIRKGGRSVNRQMPDISGSRGSSGRGVHAGYCEALACYMDALADRLRRVRVCCGDWERILGPSPTTAIGMTGVLLDPPYGVADRDTVYNHDSRDVSEDVRKWCLEHGDDPKLRICLCGYAGEHDALEAAGWDVVSWKASGGYGARNPENQNGARERLWFSPACLAPDEYQQMELTLEVDGDV